MFLKRNVPSDFVKLLDDLCNVYKDYIRDNIGSKLDVVIDKNIIKIYLYNNKEMIDEFGLTFNEKEKDKYYYVSIALMKILYNRRTIYNKDNIFYENIDGTGFKIIVNDEELFDRMFSIVSIHRDIDFYNKIDNKGRVRNKINRDIKKINLNERVNISKKLLKTRR